MRIRPVLAASCVALLAPCLWAGPAHAAWPTDPYHDVPLCTAAGNQSVSAALSDGAGGAFVAWQDDRGADPDIYVARLLADGTIAPGWPANGLAVCTAVGAQFFPVLAADGSGGAFVVWIDRRGGPNADIYASRVLGNGTIAPGWPAQGMALTATLNDESFPQVMADGAGGAYVVWQFNYGGGDWDIYATRITGSASFAAGFGLNGNAICVPTQSQDQAHLTPDGAGGAIIVWQDYRSGAEYDIFAQRLNPDGGAAWAYQGVPVCTAGSGQNNPRIITDDLGGALIFWSDYRLSDLQVYGQRLNASGDTLWAGAKRVCTVAGLRSDPLPLPDGGGGAFVVLGDYRNFNDDIFAQRVRSNGVLAWGAGGVALCAATNSQQFPSLASDGSGGMIVLWSDYRNSIDSDIYGQRVDANGTVRWTTDGVPLVLNDRDASPTGLAADAAGGAIFAWTDQRTFPTLDAYAKRVEHFGFLGDPSPRISSVKDVPYDQGGQVKVSWGASYLDADPGYAISQYRLWRSVPPNVVAEALTRGARLIAEDAELPNGPGPVLMTTTFGATSVTWELVASQIASGFPSYSLVAPTVTDSTPGPNPRTLFMVQARHNNGYAFWDSPADSGYSVDDLAPATPSPFTGAFSGGTSILHWRGNTEPDLAGYRLYRAAGPSFVPGPDNQVAAVADTQYADPAGTRYWYKLAAVDLHGNQSGFALLYPTGTTDAPGARLPSEVFLASPWPNPALRGASLRFGLPRDARVRLEVLDIAGRRLRVLADGALPAGEHALAWDGRDGEGRALAGGLYVIRLEAERRTLTRRMVVIE